jgi:ubiquinone/menaquinone biosynthesis C-methylase UbiE
MENNLYDRRARAYDFFIALVRHRRAMNSFFAQYPLADHQKILDAGCGSGALLEALQKAAERKKISLDLYGFDGSPAMLERPRARSMSHPDAQRHAVQLQVADMQHLDRDLPSSWTGFDLIVSSGMLEYIPRQELAAKLADLKRRLTSSRANGRMLLFISRATPFNRLIIERLWQANLYNKEELRELTQKAGLCVIRLEPFKTWGYLLEATVAR